MIKNVVLSGGSVKGLAFIGVVQYLEESSILAHVDRFVGTSVGAIFCFMLSIRYTYQDILQFVTTHFVTKQPPHEPDITQYLHCFETWGLDNGDYLSDLFRQILHTKYPHLEDITFLELAKCSGKDVMICGANLTKRRSEYFSVNTTPHMSVLLALRISCSLPIVFTPVTWNGDLYVDGGLYDNFPMQTLIDMDILYDVDTLGVYFETEPTPPSSFTSYVTSLIHAVLYQLQHVQTQHIQRPLKYLCCISIPIAHNNQPSSLVLWQLEDTLVQEFIKKGYNTAKTCLEQPPTSSLPD